MIRTISQRSDEDVIASSKLFDQADRSTIGALAKLATRHTYTAGQTIFRQGDRCPGLFVVDRGLVRIVRGGIAGQEHVLHLCGPSQSFAEAAVFADFDLPASAVAVQASECVMVRADAFRAELAVNHALCRQILAGMAMWTRHFVHMLDDIVMRDSIQRVARLLCNSETDSDGNTFLPGLKKDLANHLNLSSETFSRVLRQLIDRGLLETGPNKSLRIKDLEELRRISQDEV